MHRAGKWIIVALALGFFWAPAGLVAIGERATVIENHSLAPKPKLAAHWALFQQTTQYLTDHLPLRGQAVSVNSWVLEHVFNTTPRYGNGVASSTTGTLGDTLGGSASSPGAGSAAAAAAEQDRVIRGRDGWVFYGFPLDVACAAPAQPIRALSRWEALLALLHEYGRRAVLVVVPDKSAVYPGLVPASDPSERCGRRASAALWRAIEAPTAAQAGVIGLLRPLIRLKAQTPGPIYIPLDTHWNGIGSLTLAATVVPKLDRKLRLTAADVVPIAPVRRVADLTRFEGTPKTVLVPDRTVVRPPGAPKLGGATLVIGDSMLNLGFPQLKPFLANPSPVTTPGYWGTSVASVVAAMAASRTVILETGEPLVGYRGDLITPKFLQTVRAALIRAGDRVRP